MKILISGFMGCGKSSLRERLQSEANPWPILDDLDELILQQFNGTYHSLDKMIDSLGWEEFRRVERQQLEGWLAAKFMAGLLCLGGGTLEHHGDLVFSSGAQVVWLRTSFEECLRRARAQGGRPLLSLSDDELRELYDKRLKDYQKADVILDEKEAAQIHTWQQLQSCFKK